MAGPIGYIFDGGVFSLSSQNFDLYNSGTRRRICSIQILSGAEGTGQDRTIICEVNRLKSILIVRI